MFGNPCEILEINKIAKKHKLFLSEDALMRMVQNNKKVGNLSDISVFSCHQRKNLSAGKGLIVSKTKSIDKKIYKLRSFGKKT